ncbi:MAG: YbjN domain-containing protein [Paracoccaceae bacterium]
MNTWNAEKRFGKAFLDDEGDLVIEMNVNLWSGVSENNPQRDTFDWWRVVIESFEEYIGFEHATDDALPAADAPVTREAEAPTPAPATGNPTAQGIGLGTLGGGRR